VVSDVEMLKSVHLNRNTAFLILKVTATVGVVAAIFSQDLLIIFSDAIQGETTSYLLAIPFIFVYLIYRKRKMLRAVIPLESNRPTSIKRYPLIAGILLSTTAMLLYWYGSYTFTPLEYHIIALPIFTAGLTLIIFNPQTLRQLAFPILFLFFLAPPPSEILYNLGAVFSATSAEASNTLITVLGISSRLTIDDYGNPAIIITRPDGTVLPAFSVDITCSGIYSLIGFLVFAVLIAYIIRDKLWKKIAIIIIGFPLIYFLNIVRITLILLIGYFFNSELAIQIFHTAGGWILIFFGTLFLLTISEKIFKTQIFTNPKRKCSQCILPSISDQGFCLECGRITKPKPALMRKTDIIKVTIIALSAIMLMSIQAPVFALIQGPPIVVVGSDIISDVLPPVSGYNLHHLYYLTEFELKIKPDMEIAYLYAPTEGTKDPIFVAIDIASTRSPLHRWEVCLIKWPLQKGLQPKVTEIELKDIQLAQNPPIISRYFAFNRTDINQIQVVLYWYEIATFKAESAFMQKHVKISLIAEPENMEALPDVQNQLINVAKAIADYWQPIKTWSQITMIISQNGAPLTAATATILICTTILYAIKYRQLKKANTNSFMKLSKPSKQIVNAVAETEKQQTPTLKNIMTVYRKITHRKIEPTYFLGKLYEIEKIGIIESYTANVYDEPTQAWRTLME